MHGQERGRAGSWPAGRVRPAPVGTITHPGRRPAPGGPGAPPPYQADGRPALPPVRPVRVPPSGARPARTRPAWPAPPPRRGRLAGRLRLVTGLLAVLVLAGTGVAWGLYRDVTSGIATTNLTGGGWGGDGQDILLVGVDSRTDAQGNPLPPALLSRLHSGPDTGVINSDTIILVHVPAGSGAAVAFSIPRDSYVDIPGHRRDKINAAYPTIKAETVTTLAREGERNPARIEAQSAEAGRQALVDTVEELTGRTVDHYAELNLAGFYQLTNAIGGVEVCLRAPVNDPLSGARFAAGPQTVSGADALAFVRQRHGLPEGDLSRIRRQQVFLAAVAEKILSAGPLTDPGRLAGLVAAVQSSLVIDANWDLLGFARQAADIAGGNIRFLTIPNRGPETNDRGDVLLVDEGDVREFVDRAIGAQQAAAESAAADPAAAAAPRPPGALTGVAAGRYVVDVRNASDADGLAGAVAEHVGRLGFVRGTVDNTGPLAGSAVGYTGPDEDAATALAAQLGGIAVSRDSRVAPGHLLVTLGSTFDPTPVPALALALRPPTPSPPITAAGVPCID